jgi:hypothetical protein
MPERKIMILPSIVPGAAWLFQPLSRPPIGLDLRLVDPEEFNKLLAAGWQLDHHVHNGVVPLENSAIYHLIKYTTEELQALQQAQEEKKSFSLKAASLISVPLADVDAKLKDGYEIIPDKIYAKEAVLIKWQKPEATKEQASSEKVDTP